MVKATIGLAVLLILLGIGAYIQSAGVSITALIPAFFGIAFLILGIVGLKEGRRKHALHAASALSLLGLVGTANGLFKLLPILSGGTAERPAAVVVQSIMALLCLGFLFLGIRSFVRARRSRQAS